MKRLHAFLEGAYLLWHYLKDEKKVLLIRMNRMITDVEAEQIDVFVRAIQDNTDPTVGQSTTAE